MLGHRRTPNIGEVRQKSLGYRRSLPQLSGSDHSSWLPSICTSGCASGISTSGGAGGGTWRPMCGGGSGPNIGEEDGVLPHDALWAGDGAAAIFGEWLHRDDGTAVAPSFGEGAGVEVTELGPRERAAGGSAGVEVTELGARDRGSPGANDAGDSVLKPPGTPWATDAGDGALKTPGTNSGAAGFSARPALAGAAPSLKSCGSANTTSVSSGPAAAAAESCSTSVVSRGSSWLCSPAGSWSSCMTK
mmetsp:Transcript_36184/g.113975  ORF Transcript_36184/g.113975 Transcript_36184/m.113975 type:complete len:246 (-) Transcript_36184:1035-1772(-)